MKDKGHISVDKLKQYCRDHDIAVPATALRSQLEAVIVRAALHLGFIESDAQIGCFGLWEDENMNCQLCNHCDPCFEVSVGTTREKYDRSEAKDLDPRVRFQKKRAAKGTFKGR